MALKLRVISDHYQALGKRSSRLFGVTGGRIGRAQDNDWVLPDPDRYISSHHAKVSFRSGAWVLEDTSTNGIFINGADTPASMEGPYALQDGDRLRLGDYDILVSIDDRNDFPSDASGQMPVPKRVKSAPVPILADDLGEDLDITDLLSDAPPKPTNEPFDLKAFSAGGTPVKAEPAPAAKPSQSGFSSLLDSLMEESGPRTVTHSKKADDWQMQTRPYDRKTMNAISSPAALARPELARPEAARPEPARPEPARPEPARAEPARPERVEPEQRTRRITDYNPGDIASGVEAFCRGAGIDPAALPADTQAALLTLAGQVLREAVLGLTEALKGRSDLKSRLRLSQTTIQPGENNPLKFSASVDEAVLRLLDPHSTRYLGPIEAIRDSFADLRMHQTALIAAIQAGIDEFMNRIEPGELQERFDRGLKRGALLGAANKLKYWDLYVEFYQALNQRNDQGLPPVFAEELARTYAEKAAQKKR
jgi:type VI secretion system protein